MQGQNVLMHKSLHSGLSNTLTGAHEALRSAHVLNNKENRDYCSSVYNYCISVLQGKTSRTQLTGEAKCIIACQKVRIAQSKDEMAAWLSKDRNYNSPQMVEVQVTNLALISRLDCKNCVAYLNVKV